MLEGCTGWILLLYRAHEDGQLGSTWVFSAGAAGDPSLHPLSLLLFPRGLKRYSLVPPWKQGCDSGLSSSDAKVGAGEWHPSVIIFNEHSCSHGSSVPPSSSWKLSQPHPTGSSREGQGKVHPTLSSSHHDLVLLQHVSVGIRSRVAPGTPARTELWPLVPDWWWPRRLQGWAGSREWWPRGEAGTDGCWGAAGGQGEDAGRVLALLSPQALPEKGPVPRGQVSCSGPRLP